MTVSIFFSHNSPRIKILNVGSDATREGFRTKWLIGNTVRYSEIGQQENQAIFYFVFRNLAEEIESNCGPILIPM